MQISRHWRLNSQRYRLEGARDEDGNLSLQARPTPLTDLVAQPELPAQPAVVETLEKVVTAA